MTDWLKQEGTFDESNLKLASAKYRGAPNTGGVAPTKHNLAIFIKRLIVRETGKWFGDADLRLDALIVHGGTGQELYQPQTFRFPRVADGDNLAGEDQGLLIFLGKPAHFLTMSLMLARDTKDSDDLATLVHSGSQSGELTNAMSALAATSVPLPELAGLQAALRAALALGDFAYKLVREISPRCLGLYRASWLAERDRFGVGRHPRVAVHNVKDFDICYEIVLDASK